MRTAVLVLLIALISWLAAYIVDHYYTTGAVERASRSPNSSLTPKDTVKNLFWFLHLSDIHVSIYHDPDRAKDLKQFAGQVIDTINPSLVVVTGDLTDSKHQNQFLSHQYEQEWMMYSLAITNVQVPWLDMRGNHDNFNVPSTAHPKNLFKKYRVFQKTHPSYSFHYIHTLPFGNYSFVALDACPSPGVRRPYNFFGLLHEEDILTAEDLLYRTVNSNHTFLLTHYPSCTITADYSKLRNLLSWCSVHLCGHLHTVADVVPHMYGRHPDGHLQLELGDWKHNRRYRLLAVDHDLISFADVTFNQWPVVVITNPKNARFLLPYYEPTYQISLSTHIRILAFSPDSIQSVLVSIDRSVPQLAIPVPSSPLFVLPWQPSKYSFGLHTITVKVKDSSGRKAVITQHFSVDDTLDTMEWMGQLLTLSDLRSLSRMVFIFMWLILCVSLITKIYSCTTGRNVLILLLVYCINFGVGPWYIGELMDGVYGVVTVHGLLVDGQFIPGGMTYAHALLELLIFQVPLYWYIMFLLTTRRPPTAHFILIHVIFAISFITHCYGVLCTGRSYSWTAVVLSPAHGWSLPLAAWLVYKSHTLSKTLRQW